MLLFIKKEKKKSGFFLKICFLLLPTIYSSLYLKKTQHTHHTHYQTHTLCMSLFTFDLLLRFSTVQAWATDKLWSCSFLASFTSLLFYFTTLIFKIIIIYMLQWIIGVILLIIFKIKEKSYQSTVIPQECTLRSNNLLTDDNTLTCSAIQHSAMTMAIIRKSRREMSPWFS